MMSLRTCRCGCRARVSQMSWEGAGWSYGTDLGYLKELVSYWRDEFDWRAQERHLNDVPHFKTNIDGLDLHFVHRRSPEPHALPLVLIHGWPGTFFEFSKMVEPLANPVAYGGSAEPRSTW